MRKNEHSYIEIMRALRLLHNSTHNSQQAYVRLRRNTAAA